MGLTNSHRDARTAFPLPLQVSLNNKNSKRSLGAASIAITWVLVKAVGFWAPALPGCLFWWVTGICI